jgi:protein-S-isoprenylcysteine O-methyltransferase Ste14
MNVRSLIGRGDKIWYFTLPFLAVGLVLNILFPPAFRVGGPSPIFKVIALLMLVPGVVIWLWSVALLLTKARRGELITMGPYALVKHPIYTSVGLLVIPSLGFLLNTWLGALVGIALYVGARIFAPREEVQLSKTFGAAWDEYVHNIKIPWL